MKKKQKKSGLGKFSIVIIGVVLIGASIYYFYSAEQAQIRGFNFGNELQTIQDEFKSVNVERRDYLKRHNPRIR